jgi:hypothetical protein
MTIATQKTALEVVSDMHAAAFRANVDGMRFDPSVLAD